MKRGKVVGLVVLALATLGLAGGTAPAFAKTGSSAGRWVRVDSASQDFLPGTRITSVVAFRGELFATGIPADLTPGPNREIDALWNSRDGRRWQRIEPAPFGDAFNVQLAATDSALYAISAGAEGDSPRPSRVWRSTDGSTWQLLTASAPPGIGPFVAGPTRLVAVGSVLTPGCDSGLDCVRTAIWSSADGVTWTQATGTGATFPAGFMTGVVRTGTGFVAIGNQRLGRIDRRTRVWTSERGVRWAARPSPALTRAKATALTLAANARTALLTGVVPSREKVPPTTTTTKPPATVHNADGSVASVVTLCATLDGTPAVWTRSGGADWVRARVTGMGQTVPTMVVASHGTWVGAADEGDCSTSRPVFFTSTDGRHWHREVAKPVPGATAAAHRGPSALVTTPTGAIAFVSAFPDSGPPEIWLWTAPK